MDYIFVASCHGLESLYEIDVSSFKGVEMYCQSNAQRRCVWGTITLDKEVAEGLKSMITESKELQQEALRLIKTTKYRLPLNNISIRKRWLKTIPNSSLDPFAIS